MKDEAKLWQIRYTELAKTDLKGIVAYIQNVLLEPVIAKNLYHKIVASVRSLETMPYRFQVYGEDPWNSRGIRVLQVKNYLAFYFLEEETHTVWIVRILYAGRDIAKQLKEIQ